MYPDLFEFYGFQVSSYLAFNALGIIAGFGMLYFSIRKEPAEKIKSTLLFALIIFIPFLIASRAGYMIERLMTDEPVFTDGKIFFGPVSLWWGLITATLCAFSFASALKTNVWETADFFAPSIAVGGFFARLGCLLNGCCIGTAAPSGLPAVFYPYNSYAYNIFGDAALHPAPMYEALAWLFILCVLLLRKKASYFRGELITILAFLYSIARFLLEYIRYNEIPDFPTYGQMFSALIFVASITVYIAKKFIIKTK